MSRQPFYIGWQPKAHRSTARFAAAAAGLLILLALSAALAIALSQRSDGPARWQTDPPVTVDGLLQIDPYPILVVPGAEPRSLFLVQEGKIGALPAVGGMAGKPVSVTGALIARGGMEMLEIAGPQAVTALDAFIALAPPEDDPLGPVSLQGEIIDSKCFLGVMNPGRGKVHRACASLCLMGGIPPLLLAKDRAGSRAAYVLVSQGDQSLSKAVAPLAGRPVTVQGQAFRRGDLVFVRATPARITPLTGRARTDYGKLLPLEGEAVCRAG